MKSKTYWERRSAERLLDNLKDADKMVNSLKSDYQEAILNINESIEKLYGKFATDNVVSYNQAVSLIQGKEYKKWRMSMEKYLEEIAKGDEALSLELNVLCMKKRISRLEAIRAEIYANCGKLAKVEEDKVTETLTNALERNYYSSMYDYYLDRDKRVLELMHGHQVALSKANIDRVLRMPWSGDNYSKNIWKSKYQIASKLQKAVIRSILEGKSIENLTRDVSTELGNDLKHSVRRLIHTETAYVKSQGDLLTYDKLGVDEYEFLATLDSRTSSICRSLDGEHFKLEDATPGVNYPPMHPYCRSTTIVYRAEKDGTRAARDDNGETYKVDANLNYKDWYRKYVDGENSDNEKSNFSSNPGGVPQKYTKAEIDEALDYYVSGEGMWINNYLRGRFPDMRLSEDDKIYLDQLDQATTTHDVKEKTLYRSVDISSIIGDISDFDYDDLKGAYFYGDDSKRSKEVMEKYLKNVQGKEIIDKGFVSTTKSRDIAIEFRGFTGSYKPCVIEFNVPEGIKGIDLKDFDIANMEQKEVLLARNQKFVIKEMTQEQGQFYFKADLIPNNGYNIKEISLAENFEDLSNCLGSESIKLDETVKNLNFDMVKRTLSSIVEVGDSYPGAFGGLKSITTSSEGVMSCSGSQITFNPEYYNNIDKFNEMCKDCSDSGWWVKNSSVESIGVHEFGHAINWDLINNKPSMEFYEKVDDWNDEKTAKEIVSRACKALKKTEYGKGLKFNEIRARQSEYGATKAAEAIAESYADIYANKNNANPLSKKIVEIIDAMFEEYSKGGE